MTLVINVDKRTHEWPSAAAVNAAADVALNCIARAGFSASILLASLVLFKHPNIFSSAKEQHQRNYQHSEAFRGTITTPNLLQLSAVAASHA